MTAIMGSTFAHCSHLEQLSLSKRLRRIGQEAFLMCSSLREVHTPPALLYIAHRAFSGCAQLSGLHKMKDKTTWRGPCVERNAVEMCHYFDMPQWINLLPPNQGNSRTFEVEDFYFELRKDPHSCCLLLRLAPMCRSCLLHVDDLRPTVQQNCVVRQCPGCHPSVSPG